MPPGCDPVSVLMEMVIALRNEARARKNFAVSDQIRDALNKLGIELKDSPEGTRFIYKPKGDVN